MLNYFFGMGRVLCRKPAPQWHHKRLFAAMPVSYAPAHHLQSRICEPRDVS